MEDPLDGLTPQERAACAIAERVLGAVACAWDVKGRQGVVDARLRLADGRVAAFEITALAADGALHTAALLGRDDNEWPPVGEWWWSVQVGSVRDLPRLRQVYGLVARACEAAGVARPEELWRRQPDPDPDVEWLVVESSSRMTGHPGVPSREGDRVRATSVMQTGRGGGVDRALVGLRDSLVDAFAGPQMARHLEKVGRAGCDERHLFVPIHYSALPYAVSDGLWTGESLPVDPPPLPETVTHLWLAPQFGRRVLLWTPEGWQQHHPYDAAG